MRRHHHVGSLAAAALTLLFSGSAPAEEKAPAGGVPAPAAKPAAQKPSDGWPREATVGDVTYLLYPPDLDDWDGRALKGHAAVAARLEGSAETRYGVVDVSADTLVDRSTRTVALSNLRFVTLVFPSDPAKEAEHLAAIAKAFPQRLRSVSLDRLEAELAISRAVEKVQALDLRHDPPRIVFSYVPALLVTVDGQPSYQKVKGTSLERVFNTRPLLLRDGGGRHFLHVFDGWMEAASLGGPWTVAKAPHPDLAKAQEEAVKGGQVDVLMPQTDPKDASGKPTLQKGPAPAVHVATQPTELIVVDGEARWKEVPPTQLVFVENTTGHVFRHVGEARTYVLVSGRWFRSTSTDGPWEFVSGGRLPEDFAAIPDDSPKENVKASIPGTLQAAEAVVAATIPEMATVSRKEAKLTPPKFDGEPKLQAVDGTNLAYVANTATPIVRGPKGDFYAVENGVWFTSDSLKGPWAVAAAVPAEIYTIPPASALHYVTYVRVYRVAEKEVEFGYTQGYKGVYVTHGSGVVVVYGTGYWYAPWVGSVWFGPPLTYGFGVAPTYTPWTGWVMGFGFGWCWGAATVTVGWGWGPYPWWGPVGWGYYYPYPYYRPPYFYGGVAWGAAGAAAWGPGGWAATTGNVYHRYGSTSAVTRTSQGYNAWTGNRWANQVGMSYNSRTGTVAAGQRAAVGNVYTGNYAYGKRGAAYNPSTGQSVSGGKVTVGNAGSGAQGSAAWLRGESGGVARVGDDIYAGKDGTVYRKGEGGWESNSGSGWNQVDRPARGGASTDRPARAGTTDRSWSGGSGGSVGSGASGYRDQASSLDRQSSARSMGATREQSFRSSGGRSYGGSGGRAYGGGGRSYGGGGGRRR